MSSAARVSKGAFLMGCMHCEMSLLVTQRHIKSSQKQQKSTESCASGTDTVKHVIKTGLKGDSITALSDTQ